MSVDGLRERKKEKTRQALGLAAFQRFAARGFEQVTVEEIAAECDVSPRTFFRYFGSKEDVLFGEADAQRARFLAVLSSQPTDVGPAEALRIAVVALADDYERQRDTVLLRHRLVSSTPCLRTRVAERHQCWEHEVIDELRRSGRASTMSDLDARLVVAASTTAFRVATEIWVDDGGLGDLRALVHAALDRLRAGLDR